MKNIFAISCFLAILGCTTIKPYEKEYLLSPIMDDESVGKLAVGLHSAGYGEFERISVGASASAAGTSCPTCGG